MSATVSFTNNNCGMVTIYFKEVDIRPYNFFAVELKNNVLELKFSNIESIGMLKVRCASRSTDKYVTFSQRSKLKQCFEEDRFYDVPTVVISQTPESLIMQVSMPIGIRTVSKERMKEVAHKVQRLPASLRKREKIALERIKAAENVSEIAIKIADMIKEGKIEALIIKDGKEKLYKTLDELKIAA